MDVKQYMIVDLDRQGDKRMFVTEQVSSIRENKNRTLVCPVFIIHSCIQLQSASFTFSYPAGHDRPGRKGIVYKNRHITNANELLRIYGWKAYVYHVSYNNGYLKICNGKGHLCNTYSD